MNKTKKVKKESGIGVEATIKAIRLKFGQDSIMKLDQKPLVGIDSISSGSFGLDVALGIGGFPRGRIIEIFGPESSGKTTMSLHVVAEAQKLGGMCAFIDAEHAMDPEYAKKLGVKTDQLFIAQPNSGEQSLEIVEHLLRSGDFDVIVVDSVASLTPQAEIEGEIGQQHVGRQARMMSQAMRKLVSITGNSKTIIIFINQIRQNIGMAFPGAATEFTPGGKALKFYASVRLDIRRIAQIKRGEETVGGRIRVKVVKNKCAPPFRQTEFDLMYNEGISREGEILALGEKTAVLEKSGTSYVFGETKLGRGYDSARQFLKLDPKLTAEIKEMIIKKLNATPIHAKTEETNEGGAQSES